ncbi:hypothetical protein, partial [Anaerostipes hadrus]|jgi:sugar/nucleoside kinase (ribokinase family)|uniref:hypothetical protein n=1 Tax=Anaerostipes hadrus TaxID=649756 RepID=UPI003F63C393
LKPPCTERYARWCERTGVNHSLLLDFSKNLDSGACQVKNLKREKLSDFLGLTDIFSVKNVVTN